MIGFPAKPGCVVPSMMTDSLIFGSAEVGEIVCGPDPILNAIVSCPGLLFAAMMASRKLQSASQNPSLVSAVLVTVKVVPACTAHAVPSISEAKITNRQKDFPAEKMESRLANILVNLLHFVNRSALRPTCHDL